MLIIVAAGPPVRAGVQSAVVSPGLVPESDFTRLGTMKFINLGWLEDPAATMAVFASNSNSTTIPQEFTRQEYKGKYIYLDYFVWWSPILNWLQPGTPSAGGFNTFELTYSETDNGTMTMTIKNPLRPDGVTKTLTNVGPNWKNTDVMNITLKNKTYCPGFGFQFVFQPIKICDLVVNGEALPDVLEREAEVVGAESWNITGITPGAGFTMKGSFILDGLFYENDPENLFAEFVFGTTVDDENGGISSITDPLVWFNPCLVSEDIGSAWDLEHHVEGAVQYWDNQGALNGPDEIPNAFAPTYCTRPIKDGCFEVDCDNDPATDPTHEGLWFKESACYGMSSLLEFKTLPMVLSDWTSVLTPDADATPQSTKNMYIMFKPTGLSDDDIQTVLEVGGTISGFNVYIQSGLLCMGVWNRVQRYAFVFGDPGNNPSGGPVIGTPLTEGELYLAQMEMRHEPAQYDPATKAKLKDAEFKVRMILNGKSSPWYCFKGFQMDDSPSAIGGEAKGTTYGRNTGVYDDYARWFNGCVGDIMIYAGLLSPTDQQIIYDMYNSKYGIAYTYPENAPQAKGSDWNFFDYSPMDGVAGSTVEVYPNPFAGSATLDVRLGESQRVRVELYDMAGRVVLSVYDGSCTKGLNSFNINGGGLPAGVYAVKISGNNFTNIVKVALTK